MGEQQWLSAKLDLSQLFNHRLLDPVIWRDFWASISEPSDVGVFEVCVFLILSAITYYRKTLSCNRVYMQSSKMPRPLSRFACQGKPVMPEPILKLSNQIIVHLKQSCTKERPSQGKDSLDAPGKVACFLTGAPSDMKCQVHYL